jgi:hypothetical protein
MAVNLTIEKNKNKNKNKGKSGTSVHAEWQYGRECYHSRRNYKVKEIRWIRVPMSNGFVKGAAETGRVIAGVLTLGISTWFNGGIKDLSHECIEILTTCTRCGDSQRFTAEILDDDDTSFECGYYAKEYDARKSFKPSSMTLAYVEEKYNEMRTSYSLINGNCCHWASDLWDKL